MRKAALLTLALLLGCSDPEGSAPPAAGEIVPARPAERRTPALLRELGFELGAPDAPLTIYEFSDFGCRYCAEFARTTFPVLEREFLANGTVRWIFIPVASGAYPNGAEAAYAASCAGERFWDFQRILYEDQTRWTAVRNPEPLFLGYAEGVALPLEEFRECYAGEEVRAIVARSSRAALLFGVRAYPSFHLGGRLVEGALDVNHFRNLLLQMLDR